MFLFPKRKDLQYCSFPFFSSRSNIPPFVAAKTVLEGLGLDDSCQNENPVKNESDAKVKKVIFT